MAFRLLLFAALSVFSQMAGLTDTDGRYAGAATMNFLKLPAGAKSFAMGGNAISLLSDGSAVFMNPALLADFSAREFRMSHQELFAGLRREYAGLVMPLRDAGGVGLEWNLLTSGTIADARDIDENKVSPTASDLSLGVAYARSFLNDRLLIGVLGQYLQSRLDDFIGRTVAFDAAMTVKLPFHLRTSLALKNLGNGITYDRKKESLPTGWFGDLGVIALNERLEASVGVKKFTDSPIKVSTGAQYAVMTPLLLRAGYEYALPENEEGGGLKGLSAGAAVRYGSFQMDYAWVNRGDWVGSFHVFDAAYSFSRLGPLADEDYYRRAVAFFKCKDYKRCISECQKALLRNPNFWQALVLREEALRMLRVEEKELIAIAYTGNTSGLFMPTTDHGLGGLPRRAGALREVREDYPLLLTLEAGNFLSAKSDSLKRKLGYPLLKRMRYDAANLGTLELGLSLSVCAEMAADAELQLLSANARLKPALSPLRERKDFLIGGRYTVAVFGLLGEQPVSAGRSEYAENPISVLKTFIQETERSADLIVVLFSGDVRSGLALADAVPEADVIICGAAKDPTFTPLKQGRTLVVSSGAFGENLGLLVFRFDKHKKLISYTHKLIALDESVPEDEQVRRMLSDMVVPVNADTQMEGRPSPYILPFVSDYDLCAYHPPVSDTLATDSSVLASVGIQVRADSLNLDSLRRLFLHLDTLRRDSIIKANHYWGVADPSDSTPHIYLRFLAQNLTRRVSWNRGFNRNPVMNYAGSALLYFTDSIFCDPGEVSSPLCHGTLQVYDIRNGLSFRFPTEPGHVITEAVWGEDGNAIYTLERDEQGRTDIVLRRPGRQMAVNLTRTDSVSERDITLSPLGATLVYTADGAEGRQLFMMGKNGENVLRLTFTKGYYGNPVFSDDGKRLACTYNARHPDRGGDVHLISLDQDRVETLSVNLNVRELVWNGNEQLLLVSGVNYTDINVLSLHSRVMRKLTRRVSGMPLFERHPKLFNMGGKTLVCYEVDTKERSYLAQCDLETGEETILFDIPGSIRMK